MAASRIATGFALRISFLIPSRDRLTNFIVPLPHTSLPVLSVPKVGKIELRQRNADQIASLAANHFAMTLDYSPLVFAVLLSIGYGTWLFQLTRRFAISDAFVASIGNMRPCCRRPCSTQ